MSRSLAKLDLWLWGSTSCAVLYISPYWDLCRNPLCTCYYHKFFSGGFFFFLGGFVVWVKGLSSMRLEALRVLGSRNLKEPECGESRNLSPASSIQSLMEIHYKTRPQANFVMGSPRAGQAVFSKFVWLPSTIPFFFG